MNIFLGTALLFSFLGCDGTANAENPAENLAVPANLTVTECGTNSVSISWDAVAGADAYCYRTLENRTFLADAKTSGTSATVNDLKANTLYRFSVKSLKGNSESGFSSQVEATTKSDASGDPDPDPAKDPQCIGTPEQVYACLNMPADEEDGVTRAFPGADGGGMYTTGGRGGKVLHVTSLEDDGSTGTLRWAISQKYPRIIVFDVAGQIRLVKALKIESGDVTIAGQTAPGDGICIRDNNFRIAANNVIVRYMRFRMGDETATEDDALNCYTKNIPGYKNIIVDHCSMSWCTDECGSFYGVENFTLQYCILSESLKISVHDKGSHGYGGIWGGANASYHHNLLAHHDSRNPRFDHDYVSAMKGPIHYYNNVVYNWGQNSSYGGESGPGQQPKEINMVNNYYKGGPASIAGGNRYRLVNPTRKCSNCNKDNQFEVIPGKFYIDGNFMYGSADVTGDNWKGVHPDSNSGCIHEVTRSDSYMGTRSGKIQTAEQAFSSVLAQAGASMKRDVIDTRIAKEAKDGTYTYNGSKGSTNGLIDSQTDVGGWPAYSASSNEKKIAATDTDGDGIPDYYEALLGLDKNNAADAALFTFDKSRRYCNLEIYFQYLVRNVKDNQAQ